MKRKIILFIIFCFFQSTDALAKGGISLGSYLPIPAGLAGYPIHPGPGDSETQQIQTVRLNYQTTSPKLPDIFISSVRRSAAKARHYEKIIQQASKATGVPAERIKAIIVVESAFNPKAVSSAGAQGLMQLMPGTAKKLNVNNPFNTWENIMAGTLYYKRMLERFGCEKLALAAYNMGPPTLKKKLETGFDAEAYTYVQKVLYAERHF